MSRGISTTILLAVLCAGCTKDHTRVPVVTTATIQECSSCVDTFSFKKDIVPILANSYCASAGCHDFDDEEGGLELDSAAAYGSLTSEQGVITSGNPGKSIFYTYVAPGSPDPMPKGYPPLDSCDINKIYCWIQQGALNN